jgi:hypothetical protein
MMRTLLVGIVLASSIAVAAAQRGGPPAPQTPRLAASIDVTGYWVPLITEDWRYRVVTPPAGDFTSIPMSPAARKLAASWDPAKDEAAGEQCRGYGVGGVMRLPGRIRRSARWRLAAALLRPHLATGRVCPGRHGIGRKVQWAAARYSAAAGSAPGAPAADR